MLRKLLIVIVGCLMVSCVTSPEKMEIYLFDREEAESWLVNALTFKPDSATIVNIKFEMMEIGVSAWQIGWGLTKSKKAYLFSRDGKKFRVISLPLEQAKQEGFEQYMVKRVMRHKY